MLDYSGILTRVSFHIFEVFIIFKMSFWKALNSIEREDEELDDRVQEIRPESSIEPLVSELCESKYNEEPSPLQELVAVVDQVPWLFPWIFS